MLTHSITGYNYHVPFINIFQKRGGKNLQYDEGVSERHYKPVLFKQERFSNRLLFRQWLFQFKREN